MGLRQSIFDDPSGSDDTGSVFVFQSWSECFVDELDHAGPIFLRQYEMVQFTVGADAIIIDKCKEHGFRYGEDDLVYLFHLSRNFWRARGQLPIIDVRFWSGQERFGHLVHLMH